jgi:hypothetical protein
VGGEWAGYSRGNVSGGIRRGGAFRQLGAEEWGGGWSILGAHRTDWCSRKGTRATLPPSLQ